MANTRRLVIHVEQANLTGDLTDFPVLITRVNLHNEMVDPSGGNKTRTDGGDLRAFSGATPLPLEVVEWQHDSVTNAGDALCQIWIKVPSILLASGADITLEYGDAALTQPAVTDSLGRNAVWSAAAYVTHDFVKDSTGGSGDATQFGGVTTGRTPNNLIKKTFGPTVNAGANDGRILTQYSGDPQPYTVMFINYLEALISARDYIYGRGVNDRVSFDLSERYEARRQYGGTQYIWRVSAGQSAAEWKDIALIHNPSDLNDDATFYREGTALVFQLNATPTGTPSAPGTLQIGNDYNAGANVAFDGALAEFWIWSSAVSTHFLFARWKMLVNDMAGFLTPGTPESIATNASLAIAFISSAATVPAQTVQEQGNTTFALAAINSEYQTFAVSVTDQGASTLSLVTIPAGNQLHDVTLSPVANESLSLAVIASGNIVYSVTLQDQSSLVVPVIPFGNQLFAVGIQIPNVQIVIPFHSPEVDVRVPTFSNQSNGRLRIAIGNSVKQIFAVTLTTNTVPTIAPTHIPSNAMLQFVVPIAQNDDAFVVPILELMTTPAQVLLLLQSNESMSLQLLSAGGQIHPPSLVSDSSVMQVPFLAAAHSLFAVSMSNQPNDSLTLVSLASAASALTPTLFDHPSLDLALLVNSPVLSSPSFAAAANTSLSLAAIASGVVLSPLSLADGGGITFNVPHIGLINGVSPVALIVAGTPGVRPVNIQLGFGPWRDFSAEWPTKNLRRINSSPGSIGITTPTTEGRWIPQTGWLYVNPGEVSTIRPLLSVRNSASGGFNIYPGVWALDYFLQPNTGGGLAQQNQPNTASVTCTGFSAAQALGGDKYRKTLDVTGIFDGRTVNFDGGANGGWILFHFWGPLQYADDPDGWDPRLILYAQDYDWLRNMDWTGTNNSKITRASDWFDDDSYVWQVDGGALPNNPVMANRNRIQAGMAFGPFIRLCNQVNASAWINFPACLGAHSIEARIWNPGLGSQAGQISFRDFVAANGAQIIADMGQQMFDLGVKFIASLVDNAYPDSRPAMCELSNEIWNTAFELQHWYFNGIGVYLKNTFGLSGSDNGIGMGWVTAAMMHGVETARLLLKPNQLLYYTFGIQTSSTSFRADGAMTGIQRYKTVNPSHLVDKGKLCIAGTNYNSGFFGFRSSANAFGAADNTAFLAAWQAAHIAGENALLDLAVQWYTQASPARDNNQEVLNRNLFWRDWTIANNCRLYINYEGSNHDNLDRNSPSLLTQYPPSAGVWSKFISGSWGKAVQDDMINKLKTRDGRNPAFTDGWQPTSLLISNYQQLGRTRAPISPWWEQLPWEDGQSNIPTDGSALSWYSVGRTALPGGGSQTNFLLSIPYHVNNTVVHSVSFGPEQASLPLVHLTNISIVYPVDWPNSFNNFVDIGKVESVAVAHEPSTAAQGSVTFVLPRLLQINNVPAPFFGQPMPETLVLSSIVSTATVRTLTFQSAANSSFELSVVSSANQVRPVLLTLSGPATLSNLLIPSNVRLYDVSIEDSIVGTGLRQVETNPFPPNIPPDLQIALPPEASDYLQNLAETLHDVYDRIQSGGVAFPSHLLRFLDSMPRFVLGTKGKFLHSKFGFISAQYSQFYEDSIAGAPVGLSKFDLSKVVTDWTRVQTGSLTGLVTATSHPKAGEYGWVITEGRSLIPVMAATNFETGDEVIWTATGEVSRSQFGPILGRYRGLGILAGQMIPAGDIDVRQESAAAGRLLVQLTAVNASLQSLAIADAELAIIVDTLTSSIDDTLAQLTREIQTRVSGDLALASSTESLGAALRDEISAQLQVTRQAIVDGDSATIARLETARVEFSSLLSPFDTRIATTESLLSAIAQENGIFLTAYEGLFASFELAQADIVANAAAITTLNASVTALNSTVTAQAASITSLQSQVTSLDGTVAGQASVITSLNSSVTTLNGQVTTVRAQWGVTVDVNGRITGAVKLDASLTESVFAVIADKFRVYNGVATETPVFEATGGKVFVNGIPLNDQVTAEEGSRLLGIGVGVAEGTAMDGVAVNFSVAWTGIPVVVFGTGGKTSESTFSNSQERVFTALNLSTTGFTPSLKIRDLTGVQTLRTDASPVIATPVAGGPYWQINKVQVAEAFDDRYTFRFDVLVNQGQVNARLFTRSTSGGAWVLRASVIYTSNTFNTFHTITVDGLTNTAQFGLGIAGIGAFDEDATLINVTYTTSTANSTVSATPAGTQPVPFMIVGNKGPI